MHILNTFQIFRQYEPMMRERMPEGYTLDFRSQENESGILDLLPGIHILISSRFTRDYAARCGRLRLPHTPGAEDPLADELNFGVLGINEPRPVTAEAPLGGIGQSGTGSGGGSEDPMEFLDCKR